MKSPLRGPTWLLALTYLVTAGCQWTVASLPTGAASSASVQSQPETTAYSGVYQTFVKNYDGRLGGAAVTIQIGPDATCGSYIIVKPTAKKPRFKQPYYEAPIVLTHYKAGSKTASFSATATLGGGLGTLKLSGALGRKELGVIYRDVRGRGHIIAYYTGKC